MICDICAPDHVVRFTRPSPSIFAYCKRSKTGSGEGLGMRLHTSPLHGLKTKLIPHPNFKQAAGIALPYKYHICFNHLLSNMAVHIWKYGGTLLKGPCWNKDTSLRTNVLVHRVSAESVAVMTSKAIPPLPLCNQCHTVLILASHIDPPLNQCCHVLSTYTFVPNFASQSILLPQTNRFFPAASWRLHRDTKVSCVAANYVSWSKAI